MVLHRNNLFITDYLKFKIFFLVDMQMKFKILQHEIL